MKLDLDHSRPMEILIAPNAFKNALPADRVAAAIQRGLARSRLPATFDIFPVGDGGDGTGDLLVQHLHGRKIPVAAHDPFGRSIKTYWALLGGPARGTGARRPKQGEPETAPDTVKMSCMAFVEMANATGLRLLRSDELDPLRASSAGTGELIVAALAHGAQTILIGLGGSATVDGGTGILRSLGARFLNANGQVLENLPADLVALDSIDSTRLHPRLAGAEIIVLCDVENPLIGPNGAAAEFGPQKGASPTAVQRLEAGLRQFATVVASQTGKDIAGIPRGGAAGGAAAGLHGLLSARLVSGIDYFLDITGFNAALDRSTLVITGEGSVDNQTLHGKAPFGVALRAQTRGIPVVAFTGKIASDTHALHRYFNEIILINPPEIELREALLTTAANLEVAAMEWANRLAESL